MSRTYSFCYLPRYKISEYNIQSMDIIYFSVFGLEAAGKENDYPCFFPLECSGNDNSDFM